MEIALGCGLGLGPAIGGFAYDYLDYKGTMYMFALIDLLCLVVCYFMISNKFNSNL